MQRTQLESKNNNSCDVNNNSNKGQFIEPSRILPYKRSSITWFLQRSINISALKRLHSSAVVGAFSPKYSALIHVTSDRNCHTWMLSVWSSTCLFIPGQEILLLKQCEKLQLFHKQIPTVLQRGTNMDHRKCG